MPFTLSHAAIVLPLKKLNPAWFSMTGLIFGSMSPDLEYFTRMKILATHGHDWVGAIYFNIPLALAYCFVFHLFVRKILIDHLPNFIKNRFIHLRLFDWMKYFKANGLVVILSILIGTYTHLLWDAFTHEWGFFAKKINFINEVWMTIGFELKGFKVLQYTSSIIGLLFIIFWIYRMPKQKLNSSRFIISFWVIVMLLTMLISFIRFYFFPIEMISGNIIVVPMMAGFLSLIILGILNQYLIKKPQD